jgi:hypothetical protein
MQCSKKHSYSITSSARASGLGQAELFVGLELGGEFDGRIGRLSTLTLACGWIF